MLDLWLAIAHHILIFALFGILCVELVQIRPGLEAASLKRLSILDMHYGLFAGLIILVGFARAIFAAKGWDYYAQNHFFWGKIAIFVLIGLISVRPTVTLIKWRRAGATPDANEITRLRPYFWAQMTLFPLLLIFAAAMARGLGQVN